MNESGELQPIRAGDTVHINQDGFQADATILRAWIVRRSIHPEGPPIVGWYVRYDNGNEQSLTVSGGLAKRTEAGLT